MKITSREDNVKLDGTTIKAIGFFIFFIFIINIVVVIDNVIKFEQN